MAYDLEQQEQLAELKAWWKQYGTLTMVFLVSGTLALSAFHAWRYYRATQAVAASTLYEQLANAERAAEHKRVRDIAAKIIESHGSTTYALIAALMSARSAFHTGDLATARTQLQWVIDKAKDDEIRDVARLRLAAVLLDEKNPDEALKLLAAKPTDAFSGRYADMRGDLLSLQGQHTEARAAFRIALEKTDAQSPYRQMIQIKLDALGEDK